MYMRQQFCSAHRPFNLIINLYAASKAICFVTISDTLRVLPHCRSPVPLVFWLSLYIVKK